jgi:hypothetical protein
MIDCVTQCCEKELTMGMEAIRVWNRRNIPLLNYVKYAGQLTAVYDQACDEHHESAIKQASNCHVDSAYLVFAS